MKENKFLPDGYLENNYKRLSVEDVMEFAKLLENRPSSKVEELAKLFKNYITGEIHDRLIADGKMPVGVVLNTAKIQDDDFMALAIYSLGKYFNIKWLTSGSKDSDAVTFVWDSFYTYELAARMEMNKLAFSDLDFYRLQWHGQPLKR